MNPGQNVVLMCAVSGIPGNIPDAMPAGTKKRTSDLSDAVYGDG